MILHILFFIAWTAAIGIFLFWFLGRNRLKLIEIIEAQNATLERNKKISERNEKNYIANEERYSLRCKQIDVLTETIDILNKKLNEKQD